MERVESLLEGAWTPAGRAWFEGTRADLAAGGPARLPVLFPQLAREVGRHGLGGERTRIGGVEADLSAWRACDAAGLLLLDAAAPDDERLVDLFRHGDMRERGIVLRALAFLPVTEATVTLLGEIQRTNTMAHFEAGGLDSNLVVRALAAGGPEAGFTEADFRRFVLKLAFANLPLARAFGALAHASQELSRMLQDFATEREAAGRSVWTDTYRLIGHAPTEGTPARLIGGLEHGDDETRLAAAEGLAALGRGALAPYAAERLPREPRPAIRAVLEGILADAGSSG